MLQRVSYPQSIRFYVSQRVSGRFCGFHGPRTLRQSLWGRLEAQRSLCLNFLFRLGTFHTIFNHLSIITNSSKTLVCAISALNQGYNRRRFSVGHPRRRCTIVWFGSQVHNYEALLRLIWKKFIPWVMNNNPNKLTHPHAKKWLKNGWSFSVSQYNSILNRVSFQVYQLWSQYLEYPATRIASCPHFGCPTSTLLGMCC